MLQELWRLARFDKVGTVDINHARGEFWTAEHDNITRLFFLIVGRQTAVINSLLTQTGEAASYVCDKH